MVIGDFDLIAWLLGLKIGIGDQDMGLRIRIGDRN